MGLIASQVTKEQSVQASARTGFAEEPLYKRKFSSSERSKLSSKGHARPDGSYPIETPGDLENAVSAYGRAVAAGEGPAVKAFIKKRAKQLKRTDLLPDDWKGS